MLPVELPPNPPAGSPSSPRAVVPTPELNLLSAVRPDRGLIPTMIESRPGAIMHVSSIASSTAEPCRRSEPEARVARLTLPLGEGADLYGASPADDRRVLARELSHDKDPAPLPR